MSSSSTLPLSLLVPSLSFIELKTGQHINHTPYSVYPSPPPLALDIKAHVALPANSRGHLRGQMRHGPSFHKRVEPTQFFWRGGRPELKWPHCLPKGAEEGSGCTLCLRLPHLEVVPMEGREGRYRLKIRMEEGHCPGNTRQVQEEAPGGQMALEGHEDARFWLDNPVSTHVRGGMDSREDSLCSPERWGSHVRLLD